MFIIYIFVVTTIEENTANGTEFLEIEATDADFNNIDDSFRPNFSISTHPPVPFQVDSVSGLLSVAGELDREQK